MKILIGCAGIGGESELWDDSIHDITHVEINPKIAQVIIDRKPNRTVIVGDAYEYLLNNYKKFNFIWFSPSCQRNSKMIRSGRNRKPAFPDLRLYELKIFFDYNFNGKYVIENVDPYYTPPIKPTIKLGRHLFWANFSISDYNPPEFKNFINRQNLTAKKELQEWLGIYYEQNIYYKNNHCPTQILRNCVHPKLGKHVFECLLSSN